MADIDSLETLRELIRSRQVADKADVSGMEEAAGSAEDLSTGSVVPAAGPRRGRQRKQSTSAEQAAVEEPKLGGLFAGLDD